MLGLMALAAVSLFKSPIQAFEANVGLAAVEAIDTASVPDLVIKDKPATSVNFRKLQQEIAEFNAAWPTLKQQILEKEKGYIFIGETPEEALKDSKKSHAILKKTKNWVGKVENRMGGKMKKLDQMVINVDEYCQTVSGGAAESQCVEISDHIHHYEARISIYTGMMVVMKKRYEEAKAVLK